GGADRVAVADAAGRARRGPRGKPGLQRSRVPFPDDGAHLFAGRLELYGGNERHRPAPDAAEAGRAAAVRDQVLHAGSARCGVRTAAFRAPAVGPGAVTPY